MIFQKMSSIQRTTLREQVLQQILRDYVQAGKSGDILPGQRQLCAELGVSLVTVREAVQMLVERGLLERRHGSGTFILDPASRTRKHIAILMEADLADPHLSPFYPRLLQEVRLCLRKRELSKRTYLGHLRSDLEIGHLTCEELLEDVDRISGVLSLFARKHASWMHEFEKRQIPIVGVRRSANITVNFDFGKVVRSVFQRFRSQKCRHVLLLGYYHSYIASVHAIAKKVAPEYGIILEERLATTNPQDAGWRSEWENFQDALANHPDALFVSDDQLFVPCQKILSDMDNQTLAGNNFVILGSDAVQLPLERPVLRCLFSTRILAERLVNILVEMLEGHPSQFHDSVPFKFLYHQPSETSTTLIKSYL